MPCLRFLFQLREDVASCQPLATALDNGRVILCDRIADPWVRIPSPSLRGGPAGTCVVQHPTTNQHEFGAAGADSSPDTPTPSGSATARLPKLLQSLGAASSHAAQQGPLCSLLAECFLVQPGMLHLFPHPQHHLRCQAHKTLPPHPQPAHVSGGHGVGRRAAWGGRTQGGEMWAPPRPPDVFSFCSSTGSEETCPFHIPRVTALKL